MGRGRKEKVAKKTGGEEREGKEEGIEAERNGSHLPQFTFLSTPMLLD